MSEIHKRIIENLEGRVHGINEFCALSGTDIKEGSKALKDLIEAGRVRREYISIPGMNVRMDLYRLNHHFSGPKLAVDNTAKVS